MELQVGWEGVLKCEIKTLMNNYRLTASWSLFVGLISRIRQTLMGLSRMRKAACCIKGLRVPLSRLFWLQPHAYYVREHLAHNLCLLCALLLEP